MTPKSIPSMVYGPAVAVLAGFSILQLLAVALLVRAMVDVLGTIGRLL